VGKANQTRFQKRGVGSVLPTEGTSDAGSRHGRKSKETPHFQRTVLIKAKSLYKLKINPSGNATTVLNKERRQPLKRLTQPGTTSRCQICTYQAPARFQRIAERRLCACRFRSGVNHLGCAGRVFCPRRNETPAHQRQFTDWFFRVMANDRDWLGGSNVVSRRPVIVPCRAVEVFLDDLLSPRQSVTPAHWKIMAD
jgi:hypothetical protein